MKPLVIYHGNCADGFTAAWLANMHFAQQQGNDAILMPGDWVVDHHAATYGEEPPTIHPDQDVYILDFSYPPEQLLKLIANNKVTIIDHHETAIRKLAGFKHPKVYMILDTTRSGAYLTSLYFWPGMEPSDMVQMVDDRDRWKFMLPDSRNFAAGLFSRLYTIEDWNNVSTNVEQTVIEGEAIERKHHKDIDELLSQTARFAIYDGQPIMVANLSYIHSSDAGHKMLERNPGIWFAACYFFNNKSEYVWSLRSRPNECNVAKIAETFGGGGHPQASGMRTQYFPFDVK